MVTHIQIIDVIYFLKIQNSYCIVSSLFSCWYKENRKNDTAAGQLYTYIWYKTKYFINCMYFYLFIHLNKNILYKLRIRITHSQYQMLQIIELDTFNEALEWWGQTERNFINYNYFVCCLTNWINAIMSPLKTVDDQNKNVV